MMKLTKKVNEYYEEIRNILVENGYQELAEFITGRMEINDKKNSNKTSKNQELNNEITSLLISELAILNKAVTITELMNESEKIRNYTYQEKDEIKHLTNQKITYILKTLIDNENPENPRTNYKIKKATSKGKTYYSINE